MALKPKMYSVQTIDINTGEWDKKITCKGISKYIVKQSFQPSMYRECLLTGVGNTVTCHQLRNHHHQIYMMKLTKLALSSFNDKTFLVNNFESIPYSHYMIPTYKEMQNDELNALIDVINDDEGNDNDINNADFQVDLDQYA